MTDRELMQQALEALEIGYDSAKAEADQFHSAMAGYKPQRHAQMDADVQTIAKAITAIKQALAEPEQEPVNKYCCHACFNKSGQFFLDRMILCPECGNKRCPKASHHDLPCTNSNEPGQEGSIYTAPTPRKPLTDEEIALISGECAASAHRHDDFSFARAIEAAHGITGEGA